MAGDLGEHFESQIQSREVEQEIETTVSKLCIIFPGIFMTPSDPERMISMLARNREMRSEHEQRQEKRVHA